MRISAREIDRFARERESSGGGFAYLDGNFRPTRTLHCIFMPPAQYSSHEKQRQGEPGHKHRDATG